MADKQDNTPAARVGVRVSPVIYEEYERRGVFRAVRLVNAGQVMNRCTGTHFVTPQIARQMLADATGEYGRAVGGNLKTSYIALMKQLEDAIAVCSATAAWDVKIVDSYGVRGVHFCATEHLLITHGVVEPGWIPGFRGRNSARQAIIFSKSGKPSFPRNVGAWPYDPLDSRLHLSREDANRICVCCSLGYLKTIAKSKWLLDLAAPILKPDPRLDPNYRGTKYLGFYTSEQLRNWAMGMAGGCANG